MKKYLKYMILAGFAVLTAACAKDDTEMSVDPHEGMGHLQLSIEMPKTTRAEGYDALSRSTLRIYKMAEVVNNESGETITEPQLVRKYYPATEIPADVYLLEGDYKVTLEAGDQSQATFTNKSYYGEETFTLTQHESSIVVLNCKITNIAVKVVFDQTVLDKLDKSHLAYVSAADTFSKTEAVNNSVPTLKFTQNATGFFLLPEGTSNLSWGFYGEGTVLGKVEKTHTIVNPVGGKEYTLTFKYSKTPDGFLSATVTVREYEEKLDDGFIFSPQPTLSGYGFSIDDVTGYFDNPVQFKLTSIDAISTVTMTADGQQYAILDANGNLDATAAANGISYTAENDYSGTIAFDGNFFAKLPGGIHDMAFVMRDKSNVEGKATGHVAVQGTAPLTDYDLWTNTANFKAIVTDPSIDNVTIHYRADSGDWKELTAVKGADYTFTAIAEPAWNETQNAKGHTLYKPDTSTGLWAGRTYEYYATIGTTQAATRTLTTAAGDTIPTLSDSGLSCYGKSNTSESNFWGSGNNGATPSLCTYDGGMAKMGATSTLGILAPGNLFSGTFSQSGTNGTVYFGNKYTYSARPSAMTVTYKASTGAVTNTKYGSFIPEGELDEASIMVLVIDWTSKHEVTAGTSKPSGMWSPDDGPNAVSEGTIIGYATLYPKGSVLETTATLEIQYYDKTAKPTPGHYSLVVSCATSRYGDYMNGCKSNTLHVKDFNWVY